MFAGDDDLLPGAVARSDAPAASAAEHLGNASAPASESSREPWFDSNGPRDVQSYQAFRTMLGMPPGEQRVEPMDETFAVPPVSIAAVSEPRSPPARAAAGGGEVDDDAELFELDAMHLQPGGTRDVTKSPQHHKLHLDNWAPEEDASGEDGGDEEEPHGQQGPGAGAEGGAGESAVSCAASAGAAEAKEEGRDHAPEKEELPLPLPGADAAAASVARAYRDATTRELAEMAAEARVAEAEEVGAFSLDPDFDYDNVKLTGEKFSVARALVEGEFYDRQSQGGGGHAVRP